jgi:hypothetical protein
MPSESRLELGAIARGWIGAATPQIMEALLRRQAAIAISPSSSPRDASRAAEVFRRAVEQVMRDEERQTSREEADRMYALALERARQSQQPDGPAPGNPTFNIAGPVQIYIPDNGRAACPIPQQ